MNAAAATAIAAEKAKVHYADGATRAWLWAQAPCRWHGKVELNFRFVPLRLLKAAGSLKDPAVIGRWLQRMQAGRAIPPLLVCARDGGTYYVRDGNHRLEAIRTFLASHENAQVRVAVAIPKPGFQFRYRFFGSYSTYILEPESSSVRAPRCARGRTAPEFGGQTLVLVAHPDDETGGCAGLLQRLADPVVVFATEGAPADKFFWGPYGSQRNYASIRRYEAAAALATAGVQRIEFLTDHSSQGHEPTDQRLYCALPAAFDAVCKLIRKYEPDSVIVPAYEGGHPDHDACSVLGALLRRSFGHLHVCEMPLYHRSDAGTLVCKRFRQSNGTEVEVELSVKEIQIRAAMAAQYASQPDLGEYIAAGIEYYRPQVDYDYSQPPHAGLLNYQVWRWPISPESVCREFMKSLSTSHSRTRITQPAAGAHAACGVI